MNRKRSLISETFRVKKRAFGADSLIRNPEHEDGQEGPRDVKACLQYLMSLFPRKLFDDSLPQIVYKHQLYSLLRDKTLVDKQLNELRDQGELLMFQLGFDTDTFALVFTEDYRAKVLVEQTGKDTHATVEKFLDKVLSSCSGLSFSKCQMLNEFLFTDSEITQLVKSGVLTVRDAGSWWLSIPNSGRFTKYFIQGKEKNEQNCDLFYECEHFHQFHGGVMIAVPFVGHFINTGRKAILGMVKKSKYNEILKADLEERRTNSQVKFDIKYHIHDIIGAELVECIQTTSGTLLRFVDT